MSLFLRASIRAAPLLAVGLLFACARTSHSSSGVGQIVGPPVAPGGNDSDDIDPGNDGDGGLGPDGGGSGDDGSNGDGSAGGGNGPDLDNDSDDGHAPVPEPATLLLLGGGLAALAAARRKSRR